MPNPNFSQQGTPVPGGYAQPASGITEQIETPADPSGNAYATSLASGGVANLQTANFRDSVVTVQATGIQAAPTAGTVVATCTPGTAGLWEVEGSIAITGTTVAATDSNNMGLYQTGTSRQVLQIAVPGTTGSTVGWSFGPVVLNLSGADTVNIKAIASATASSSYNAQIICRRVG